MNKIIPILFFLFTAFFLFSSPLYAAQEEPYKSALAIGGEAHHLSIANSKIEGVEIGFDSTTEAHVVFDYRPLQDWAVKLGMSTLDTDIEVGRDDRFEHYGTFSRTSLSLTLLYMTETKKNSPFKMYMGGGLAYHMNDLDRDSQNAAIADFFALNRTISKIENSMGLHGTMGFKYLFSEHLFINLSITMSATNAKAEVTYPDSTVRESDIAINAVSIGTGLQYKF